MLPFGLPALQAILASCRLAAKPIEQAMNGPTLSAIRFLIRRPSARGSPRSDGETRHVSSSMDLTASTGMTAVISEMQRVVRPAVEIGRLRHQDDVGAALARFLDVHDVLDAAQLGLARTGNDAGVLRVLERHDAHGLAAQVRMHLLLDRGEEAVEVEIQAFDFDGAAHGSAPERGSEENRQRTESQ